tara:strand:+ start:207 stop:629 length:423 start_codon:yes stop_codon:yes gene_type:complete
MAHFAKLGVGNKVLQVVVLSNDTILNENGEENEQMGVDYLNSLYGTSDVWKQTSYNTLRGVHKLDGTPFRKNYAGIDYSYDEVRDAFYSPQPYPSWILNETTCHWQAPVPYPETDPNRLAKDENYSWNEETKNWDLQEAP